MDFFDDKRKLPVMQAERLTSAMMRLVPGVVIALAFLVSGCSSQASPAPTPDVEATVQARVQATIVAAQTTTVAAVNTALQAAKATPIATVAPQSTDAQKMAAILTVSFKGMTLTPKDIQSGRFNDTLSFSFDYTNKGTSEIRAFTGVVTFADLFGRPIKQLNLTYQSRIAAGQTVTDNDKGYELNPFMKDDQQLSTTKASDMKVSFEPRSILLADGTQLGTVKPQLAIREESGPQRLVVATGW